MCCVSQSQGFLCGKMSPLRLCPVVNTMEQTGSPSKVSFPLFTAVYSGLFSKGQLKFYMSRGMGSTALILY